MEGRSRVNGFSIHNDDPLEARKRRLDVKTLLTRHSWASMLEKIDCPKFLRCFSFRRRGDSRRWERGGGTVDAGKQRAALAIINTRLAGSREEREGQRAFSWKPRI